MEFTTTKTWQRVNSDDGDHRYEKVWFGAHLFGDVMISFKDGDGDLFLEVVLAKTIGRKFFTKWVALELIELDY